MKHVNAEILRAIADGEKVQYRSTLSGKDWIQYGPWEDFDGKDVEACWSLLTVGKSFKWRIAPKIIMIGEHEVPEPCREPLERNTNYWTFTPFYGVVSPVWMSHPGWSSDIRYRRKPQTVKISDFEVPEPCKASLKYKEEYFVPNVASAGAHRCVWTHSYLDLYALESNLVHLDRRSAALHAKALVEVSKGWWK